MIRFILASLLALAAATSMSWMANEPRHIDSAGAGNGHGGAASQQMSGATTLEFTTFQALL